jgi:hypothetical protein
MVSVVSLDRIADRGAADDAGCGHRRFSAATTELVTNESADDGAEHRASASRPVLDVDASYVANRAAGLATARVILIGRRWVSLLGARRRVTLLGARRRVTLIAARRIAWIGTTLVGLILVGPIGLVVDDCLARGRRHAGGKTTRTGQQQREESFVERHD